MVRHAIATALVCAAGIFGQGCATIVHGTTQEISVSSDPTEARVNVDGAFISTTPCTVELKRGKNHVVTISKDGYHTEQITVMKVVSGAVAGNILAGGFIGWGVDAISGAQYRLVPETVSVTLRTLATGETAVSATTDPLAPEARLRQIEKLRSDGLITEDEYKAMRDLILKELRGG